jgi:hypothetical protein
MFYGCVFLFFSLAILHDIMWLCSIVWCVVSCTCAVQCSVLCAGSVFSCSLVALQLVVSAIWLEKPGVLACAAE